MMIGVTKIRVFTSFDGLSSSPAFRLHSNSTCSPATRFSVSRRRRPPPRSPHRLRRARDSRWPLRCLAAAFRRLRLRRPLVDLSQFLLGGAAASPSLVDVAQQFLGLAPPAAPLVQQPPSNDLLSQLLQLQLLYQQSSLLDALSTLASGGGGGVAAAKVVDVREVTEEIGVEAKAASPQFASSSSSSPPSHTQQPLFAASTSSLSSSSSLSSPKSTSIATAGSRKRSARDSETPSPPSSGAPAVGAKRAKTLRRLAAADNRNKLASQRYAYQGKKNAATTMLVDFYSLARHTQSAPPPSPLSGRV